MSTAPFTLAAVQGAAASGEKVGAIVLALLAAAVVLGSAPLLGRRLGALLMLATIVLSPVLLAIDIWHTSVMSDVRDHPALAVVGILAGILVLAVLALLMRRWRSAFPLAAVFTLPFRVPISIGGTTANLLIPLYVVIAAGALAHLVPRLLHRDGPELDDLERSGIERSGIEPGRRDRAGLGDDGRGREVHVNENGCQGSLPADSQLSSLASDREGSHARRGSLRALGDLLSRRRALEWLLMAYVVLYAIQATYSPDFSKGFQNLVFFYVPFALLFKMLTEVRWTSGLLKRCFGVVVALAAIFVAVGLVEFGTKSLLLNSSLVAKDVYGNYFRVNSLFYDPNIYGRFLALAMVLLATAVLFAAKSRRDLLLLALALAWLWVGLVTSISQSSMVALLLGLAVLAAWRWDARYVGAAAVVVLAAAVVFLLAAPSSLHFGVKGSGGSLNNASSGRVKLVEGGLKLFAKRPIAGFGSGSFAPEYRSREVSTAAAATSASHTTPITIAAEQGVLGLVVYLALLLVAFLNLCLGAGRSPPRPKPGDARLWPKPGDARLRLASPLRPASPFRPKPGDPRLWLASPFRPAIAACFAALVLHTMAYADFLEDPTSWALLGIGVALAAAARRDSPASERDDAELAAA